MKLFPPNLPPGSNGAAVRLLQYGLIAAGFGGGATPEECIIPDGKYGAVTTKAVKALQLQLAVEPTGEFDEATRAALKAQRGLDVDGIEQEDVMNETFVPAGPEQPQLAGVP